jgi:hypothetical protein
MNKYIARSFAPSRSWLVPLLGFILAFGFSGMLAAVFPNSTRLEGDLWFGADIVSVIWRMTDPVLSGRLNVHPLFALVILPVVRPLYSLAMLAGFDKYVAMGIASQLVTSLSAGITWLLMYGISINLGLSKIQAFILGLLFLSSSTFMFWWSTPESFPLGSPTILFPFLLLSLRVKSYKLWLLSLVASASMTITNFGAGLAASCAQFGFRRPLIGLCGLALAVVGMLSIVQKSYINGASLPFQIRGEKKWINFDNPPAENFYQFLVAPVVPLSPPVFVRQCPNCNIDLSHVFDKLGKERQQLSFAILKLSNINPLGALAGIGWLFLLLNGVCTALQKRNKTCMALMAFAAFQFFLHFFYGDSPFLYSAHYTPVLVLIAGYGLAREVSKTYKMLLNSFALVLIGLLFSSNIVMLNKSFVIGESYMAERCALIAPVSKLRAAACSFQS